MKQRIAATAGMAVVAVGLILLVEPQAAGMQPSPVEPSAPAVAEGNTITVTVSGDSIAQPSHLAMKATVTVSAEVGEEAVTNFAQSRTRAQTALSELGFGELAVEGGGVSMNYLPEPDNNNMNNMVFFDGSGMEAPTYGVTCKEDLELRFKPSTDAVEQRSQVALAIDTAVELGLKLKGSSAPNPYVYMQGIQQTEQETTIRGLLSDEARATAELEAQKQALDNARRTARGLAELSGRTLGGVNSINVTSLSASWQGIGAGMKVSASMVVTFDLQ